MLKYKYFVFWVICCMSLPSKYLFEDEDEDEDEDE